MDDSLTEKIKAINRITDKAKKTRGDYVETPVKKEKPVVKETTPKKTATKKVAKKATKETKDISKKLDDASIALACVTLVCFSALSIAMIIAVAKWISIH